MSRMYKKTPFKVPDGYFNHFDKKLAHKIDSINPNSGYITPLDYFQKAENQILGRIDYPKQKSLSYWSYTWKAMAVGCMVAVFYFNETNAVDQNELAEFFIEDYLTTNTTYEIADHSDYYFEVGNFIENYESIDIDDALEIRLYGETPINLNLFDDE
ncbi:hypothetical protein N9T96_01545 [Flavobacteriaceae bacterium]|nr:hypothetical protein [Flavobacteriaceae bacterium]